MIIKVKCEYCESENLSVTDVIYGEGTKGERKEKAFKCNGCDEILELDEVIIEEVIED